MKNWKKNSFVWPGVLALGIAVYYFGQGEMVWGWSIAAAAILMTLNFWLLKRIGLAMLSDDSGRQIKGGFLMVVKLLGLFAAVYFCTRYFPIDPLVFGISAAAMVMLTAVMMSIFQPTIETLTFEDRPFEDRSLEAQGDH